MYTSFESPAAQVARLVLHQVLDRGAGRLGMGVATIRTTVTGVVQVVVTSAVMASVNLGLLIWYDPLLGGLSALLVAVHAVVFLVVRRWSAGALRDLWPSS